MFNVISTMDFAACLCSVAAVILIVGGWSNNRLPNVFKLTLFGLIILTLFHDFTNVLQWSGIAYVLEVEYYVEILVPVLWFLAFYSFSQDVATHKLQQAMERYKTLFETAGEAIVIVDISDSEGARFIDCNSATLRMLGYRNKKDILRKSPEDFSPKIQADGMSSHDKIVELTSKALENIQQSFEWKHMRSDGTLFDAEVNLSRIELDDKYYVLATMRDITGRKNNPADEEHSDTGRIAYPQESSCYREDGLRYDRKRYHDQ